MSAQWAGNAGHPIDIGKLKKLVLLRAGGVVVMLGLVFFIPAGTLWYWQAWVFMATLGIPAAFLLLYFLKRDPEVIERRMKLREKEPGQKRIMKFSYLLYVLIYLIPALDRRFGWSSIPVPVVLAADLLVFLGYLIFIAVLKSNRYASRIIEVEPGQRVIATGPYAIVRHPMYVGALMVNFVAPLALGSAWGLLPSVLTIPFVIARILNEEQVLVNGLDGYAEYMLKTKYRLIPFVW